MSRRSTRTDLDIIVDIIPPESKVLDLGCGDGELLIRLSQQKSVIGRGIELTEAGVRHCVAAGLSVRQGDIDEGLGDYPTDSFDYVILSQTLPYVDDPKSVLCEMLRVGRHAIVSFPNLAYWRARVQLLFRGHLPQTVFSSLPWYESPRARPISIDDFLSLCVEQKISVLESTYLSETAELRGMRKTSWLATTGLFVLQGYCPQSSGDSTGVEGDERTR
jgi:methionine biosynthesis protein MetW